MKLLYRAVNEQGKTVHGLVEAKDASEAAVFLRKQGLFPIAISEFKQKASLMSLFKRKSASTDIVFFTRQLSSMLTAGLTLMQALNILKGQIQSPLMIEVVNGLISSIEEGKSFSLAIQKYPQVFSPIYVSLIQAAEGAGLLDKILLRLADNLEKQQKLKSMIRSAMMYPIIVVTLMVAVMAVMMIFVIPQLTALYNNLDVPLPLPTRIVIGISKFMGTFWPVIIVGVFGGLSYFRKWKKTPRGQKIVDAIVLKSPIFGKLTSQSIMVEFSRTFGLLVGTGSLVVESLNQSSDVVGNVYYRQAIREVGKKVEKGISIGDAMLADPLFPSIIVEMVKIGEQTGKLDESLMKVSEYFEREVEQTIKTLTTAMEPFIMIILAVGVGFLILSIITPIYNLISQIQ
ncbi:MAG TPA: type II secretion system F family protein [Patescibacteria group bacterium]|nr:type II secretion system F family protein [Patescibacteria group bacterium]